MCPCPKKMAKALKMIHLLAGWRQNPRPYLPTSSSGLAASAKGGRSAAAQLCFMDLFGMRLRLRGGGSPHSTTAQDDSKFSSSTRQCFAPTNFCMEEISVRVKQYADTPESDRLAPRQVLPLLFLCIDIKRHRHGTLRVWSS